MPSETAQIAGLKQRQFLSDLLTVVKDAQKQHANKLDAIQRLTEAQNVTQNECCVVVCAQIHAGPLKTLKIVQSRHKRFRSSPCDNCKNTTQVEVKIIHSGVGSITESDVLMASASKGVVVGVFPVLPCGKSCKNANVCNVLRYNVIYHLTDELKKLPATSGRKRFVLF